MPGVWKKTLTYLGLVEDEDYEELGEVIEAPVGGGREPAAVRRISRQQHTEPVTSDSRHDAIVRTIPQARPAAAGSIHSAAPKRFNEAREIGDRFKQGVPVIMNLQGTEDAIARRLVDFASGLVFGLDGKIEPVANRVYLLTPEDMEVSAEERERLREEGGFYNQF
jgi:cell division inhibitor SepF